MSDILKDTRIAWINKFYDLIYTFRKSLTTERLEFIGNWSHWSNHYLHFRRFFQMIWHGVEVFNSLEKSIPKSYRNWDKCILPFCWHLFTFFGTESSKTVTNTRLNPDVLFSTKQQNLIFILLSWNYLQNSFCFFFFFWIGISRVLS